MTHDLDAQGLHVSKPGSIRTWTGQRVDPLEMAPEEVSIEDIARALSRQCRYNGHVGGFLSVARHSVMVSEHLEPCGRTAALWGLLHDAAEAYLGDLVRPLKHGDFGHAYLEAEERVERVIAEAFDLPYPMPDYVKDADNFVLNEFELGSGADARDGMRDTYQGDPDEDERAFLDAYASLTGGTVHRTVIVGLHGVAQSGKDTAGSFLITREGFERIAFADVMRNALLALDPLVTVKVTAPKWHGGEVTDYRRLSQLIEERGWDRAKTEVPEVRQLLQRFGTEAGRMVHGEDVWVDLALAAVKLGGRYVVTDVRFANEAEAIRKLGGEVWRITRPGVESVNAHVSDAGLPDALIDRTIANDGTRADLRKRVLTASDTLVSPE